MRRSGSHFSASEAARRLGISVKALRLYERHGLLPTPRTAAGWRTYGPREMARAEEIVALRTLGLGLSQIKSVLAEGAEGRNRALASHQTSLERQLRQLGDTLRTVQAARTDVAATVASMRPPEATIALDLPWPWGGERFTLSDTRPVTYITGPLGSGKTRLARALAEAIPGARFIGLDRLAETCAAPLAVLDKDPALKMRVAQRLSRLAEDGAAISPALTALVACLEATEASTLVVDMVEQGLDQATQEALRASLRSRSFAGCRLFLLTRSSSILSLKGITDDEAILFCPANHDMPFLVTPHEGARGYEAVATCLATPAVRSRTEGVIAWRPDAA